MNPVTKQHRLSVARAWFGNDELTEFLQCYVDGDKGPYLGAPSVVAQLERLAQLVADAEPRPLPETELVIQLTEVMREADRKFEKVGGSTRHHVRDCLIPELEAAGLTVVRSPKLGPVAEAHRGEDGSRNDVPTVVENTGGLRAEPAQENQGPSGQKENDNGNRNDSSAAAEQRETGDPGLARSEADSARDDRCPEGGTEVAGEGIGHHQARRSAAVGRRSDDGRVAELEAKVAELEQERADLHGALGDMEYAAKVAETEAEVRRLALVVANGDRDAERAQKEAALALAAEWEKLRNLCYRDLRACQDKRDALRAENEGLKANLERSEFLLSKARPLCGFVGKLHTESVLHPLVRGYVVDWMAALIEPAQQPTEAAPVAKAEAPEQKPPASEKCPTMRQLEYLWWHGDSANGFSVSSEKNRFRFERARGGGLLMTRPEVAKAEAPSEPAGWVPKVGDRVRVCREVNSFFGVCGTVTDTDGPSVWPVRVELDNGSANRYPLIALEPAPQPPATTGGDRPQWLINPATELLNQCRAHRDIDTLLRAVEMLFEHNERTEFWKLEAKP